jgi:hypothetical protein
MRNFMRQWEYHQVVCPIGQELALANQLGIEGWEMVSMAHVNVQPTALAMPGMQAAMGWLLMFKRRKAPVLEFTETRVSGNGQNGF